MYKKKMMFLPILIVFSLTLIAQSPEQRSKEKINGYELKIKELLKERKKLKDSIQDLEDNIKLLESIKNENENAELRNKNKNELLDKISNDSVQILKIKESIQIHELNDISKSIIKEKQVRVDKLLEWINNKKNEKKAIDDSLNLIIKNSDALKKQYLIDEGKKNQKSRMTPIRFILKIFKHIMMDKSTTYSTNFRKLCIQRRNK
jgi:hypothetical protein